ncbi:hypothetical protein VLK31_05225 [Variovorax sp. H27-G14]
MRCTSATAMWSTTTYARHRSAGVLLAALWKAPLRRNRALVV